MSNFERITAIDRFLQEGTVTVARIAKRFEVSPRTAKRDIEYMRDRLNAPIIWDKQKKAYRYSSEFHDLKFADEKALIVHALLKNLLSNEHYVPLFSSEMLSEAEQRVSREYRQAADRIRYELPVSEHVDLDAFTAAVQAMALDRRVDLVYKNAKGEQSSRSVEAERLVNYAGRWYLIAWDHLRKGLRTFHLSRVEAASLSKEKNAAPQRGSRSREVEEYLASGFGIFKGERAAEAVIRIRGDAALLVSRQTWHPEQRITTGVNVEGEPFTDLTIPVASWTELLGRVLSFGSKAEALAPPEFRELWKAEVRKMAALTAQEQDKGEVLFSG
jgi:predicted DNA-binding transcriptional regulator YafY